MRITLTAVFFVALLGAVASLSPALQPVDARVLDAQFQFLRWAFPRPVERDVVIVGIDPVAMKRLPEPIALWHKHLGKFFSAMAQARAAGVGIDVILPDRSHEAIVPGYDAALMRGIVAARKDAGLVLGLTTDQAGVPHQIYKPFLAVAGGESTAWVNWTADPDGVVRRYSEGISEDGKPVPTLSGQVARKMGVQPPGAGLVDFWRGDRFRYTPLTDVLDWFDNGNVAALQERFAGKPVFLGVVLPFEDRVPMPVALWDKASDPQWEKEPDSKANPGVMVHAQALRSMLGHGLIKPLPGWMIALAAVASALLWLGAFRPWPTLGLFVLIVAAALAASTVTLANGWYVPTAAIIFTAGLALGGRLLYETALRMRDHARLRGAFAGSVSPQVLAEITAGRLSPNLSGARARIAVVFIDVRGFTARAEALGPETVIALLNRYFEQVITSTHQQGGTIDKFLGDGIMAYFGAPQRVEDPAAAAVAAAKDILNRMGRLNALLKSEGTEPIEISIGIHTGEAVVGHIGSKERYEYTAIGDVVNVASRLESLTKEVGYALVCTREVIEELGNREGFVDLGARPIRGHTPVDLFGFERRRGRRADESPKEAPANEPAQSAAGAQQA